MRNTTPVRPFVGLQALCGLVALLLATGSCVEDPDCGVCDPDNLILESVRALNYAGDGIDIVSPLCVGDACPEPFTKAMRYVNPIGPCEETDGAKGAARGAEEYCKVAPISAEYGFEFLFNNSLEPSSVELTRFQPANPNLHEVYDWKTQILAMKGPISRFNGDYFEGGGSDPDLVTRSVNLSCIENLGFVAGEDRDGPDGVAGIDGGDFLSPETNPCNTVRTDVPGAEGQAVPVKMEFNADITSYRGILDTRVIEQGCDTPQEGADLCCDLCDFELSVNVAKYGLIEKADPKSTRDDVKGLMRTVGAADPAGREALACTTGDKFRDCQEFNPWVYRGDEPDRFKYAYDGEAKFYPMPRADRLREDHPANRPFIPPDPSSEPPPSDPPAPPPDGVTAPKLERRDIACTKTSDCTDPNGPNLAGAECVGMMPDGKTACDPALSGEEGCTNGRCMAEWFVECVADADPSKKYCADRRFDNKGGAACLGTDGELQRCSAKNGSGCQKNQESGFKELIQCDTDGNGIVAPNECCQTGLGGEPKSCDPLAQPDLVSLARYERKKTLPDEARECTCPAKGEEQVCAKDYKFDDDDPCANVVPSRCCEDGEVIPGREGQYAQKFRVRYGGVILSNEVKGVKWEVAHRGGFPRAMSEKCAEKRGLINGRNVLDGWRYHSTDASAEGAQNFEDFDRSLCSDSEYEVIFATPPTGDDKAREYLVDKVGNSLAGKNVYKFRTSKFHVDPGSGFPADNLRVGACDAFSIRLTNKYDLSPENLAKIELWEVRPYSEAEAAAAKTDGNPQSYYERRKIRLAAGGRDCAKTYEEVRNSGKPPCLVVDVGKQSRGELSVRIDTITYKDAASLEKSSRYRLHIPYVSNDDWKTNQDAYQAAFWDACGMPLYGGNDEELQEAAYEFTIDPPKCKEDEDGDEVPASCDNSRDYANAGQENADGDVFGDVEDLCVTVPFTIAEDSDRDGVGNLCDTCRRKASDYNGSSMGQALPANMWVRNIPWQQDTDQDGIGDVCDNCVHVANCGGFDAKNPWKPGIDITALDRASCQVDATDGDGNNIGDRIGDACQEPGAEPLKGAAGPVGFADADDFDQDGLANGIDFCPRQPVERVACTSDADCPNSRCAEVGTTMAKVCNHVDIDNDRVGDICDSCPFVANEGQVIEGSMQDDDPDGDFVGAACEPSTACEKVTNARPYSFYQVSTNGFCCTTMLTVDPAGAEAPRMGRSAHPTGQVFKKVGPKKVPLYDPLGRPVVYVEPELVRRDPGRYVPAVPPANIGVCTEQDEDRLADDERACRRLPNSVVAQGGMLFLAPGCAAKLSMGPGGMPDPSTNAKLTEKDFGGDLDALWTKMCFLPPWDQDFDGVGDRCDLCPYVYDPNNTPYQNEKGKIFPGDGAFCNGDFNIEKVCAENDGEGDTSGGDTSGGDTGGGADGP